MLRRRRGEDGVPEAADDGREAHHPRWTGRPAPPAAITPRTAFAVLAAARLISAVFNIIHDCDETYNYLEPLHFLLFGSGMQTWEYSAQYALRSYLYLVLHAPAAGTPSMLLGPGRAGKLAGFYLLKVVLGLASAATEAWLYRAVARRYRPAVAHSLLLFLAVSAGMFASSTSVLPSTFTMYALTAAAAGMLEGRPYPVIAAAAVGVVWGWCVAGFAFLPYALWVLAAAPLLPAVGALLASLALTLGPLVLVDRYYYGEWTASLWNFIRYNVVGGGDSALYGVEDATFYLRNGFNNFHLLLPLALLFPAVAAVAAASGGASLAGARSQEQGKQLGGNGGRGGDAAGEGARAGVLRLLVCVSPLYVWLAAITALPHKEERFLYVAYPLICLAAAASFVSLLDLGRRILAAALPQRLAAAAARAAAAAFLGATCLLAVSRSAALVVNYGAPMRIYRHLPEVPAAGPPLYVCSGAEWYRFPSTFFLPPPYRLAFIKSGFSGLLPRQFDAAQGTRGASPHFNDRNREDAANYWPSAANCSYVVTLREAGSSGAGGGAFIDALGASSAWETVASLPFVDNARSPQLARAFYLPRLSAARNTWVDYVLLKRRQP